MPNKPAIGFPTEKELDELVASPISGECSVLCADLLNAVEQLQGSTGISRLRIMAHIRALRSRMKELKCPPCLPS